MGGGGRRRTVVLRQESDPIYKTGSHLSPKAETGRIKVQGQAKGKSLRDPISKITRAKWSGGMAQAVERLSSES
jgi:hypothetical protein